MTPKELAELLRLCLVDLAESGSTKLQNNDIPAEVKVERPRHREHGDWASNIAMQLGGKAGKSPRELAELLSPCLQSKQGVSGVEIAGPGFINIRLEAGSAGELVGTILEQGSQYGTTDHLAGQNINLEFVSANPTGPIHLGGARWAAVGDVLARLLENSGAEVVREYYFNDHGSQIDLFAASLLARARGEEPPTAGYGGDYVDEVAQRVREDTLAEGDPDPVTLPEKQALEVFRQRGVNIMFAEIKEKLREFGVEFDVFFHEDSLHLSGAVDKAIEQLDSRGVLFRQGGALWLRSTDFGDDKDRVLIKSDGHAAYLSGDVAYYLDKRERGTDTAIYLLGADHHGYVGRMMAVCAAFGDEPGQNMEILIGQMVNLLKDGKPVRMSKRAGTVITMDDLVEAVGVDAARYSLVRVSTDSNVSIDLDLLTQNTNENPVYYVQYAHARTRSVARNAKEHGVYRGETYNAELLDQPADGELLGVLAQYPEVVNQAANLREPHRVARYLEELAGTYHQWYAGRRVTPRAQEAVTDQHVALLWLNEAVAQVLQNGLGLLGVSAPERM